MAMDYTKSTLTRQQEEERTRTGVIGVAGVRADHDRGDDVDMMPPPQSPMDTTRYGSK